MRPVGGRVAVGAVNHRVLAALPVALPTVPVSRSIVFRDQRMFDAATRHSRRVAEWQRKERR